MYSCPQGLSPRTLIGEYKGGLRKAGVKIPKDVPVALVKDSRKYRKVPEERLEARLGLTKYDVPAPLDDNVVCMKKVKVLLSQHIGAPAKAAVNVGDVVTRGQVIGIPAEGLSVPIHASITGKVTDVKESYISIEQN